MSKNAATNQVARLRAAYTGESPARARNALIATPFGRELRLLGRAPSLLNLSNPVVRSPHEANLAARLRPSILPDATTWQQELLDTAVLLGIKGAFDVGPEDRPVHPGPYLVLKSVTPRPTQLVVKCHPGIQAGLLSSLVGTKDEDGGYYAGVPGVRIRWDGGKADVFLAGSAGAAHVVVRDVSCYQWERLLTHLKNLKENGRLFQWPILKQTGKIGTRTAPGLEADEQRALREAQRYLRHTRLSSRMVRRIGLVADSYALDAWTGVGGDVHLEFQVPGTADEVSRALHHPLAGFVSGSPPSSNPLRQRLLAYVRIAESGDGFQIHSDSDPLTPQPPRLVLRPLPWRNEEAVAHEATLLAAKSRRSR